MQNALWMRSLSVMFAAIVALVAMSTVSDDPTLALSSELDVPQPTECRVVPWTSDHVQGIIARLDLDLSLPIPPRETGSLMITSEQDPLVPPFTDTSALDISVNGIPWIVDGVAPRTFPAPISPILSDSETDRKIRAIVRESTACKNAGDALRLYALSTDDYVEESFAFFVRQLDLMEEDDPFATLREALAQPPVPRPEGYREVASDVISSGLLPDGRAVAIIVPNNLVSVYSRIEPGDSVSLPPRLFILEPNKDGWLIDDIIQLGRHVNDQRVTPTPGL